MVRHVNGHAHAYAMRFSASCFPTVSRSCGGTVKIIASIHRPRVVVRILQHLERGKLALADAPPPFIRFDPHRLRSSLDPGSCATNYASANGTWPVINPSTDLSNETRHAKAPVAAGKRYATNESDPSGRYQWPPCSRHARTGEAVKNPISTPILFRGCHEGFLGGARWPSLQHICGRIESSSRHQHSLSFISPSLSSKSGLCRSRSQSRRRKRHSRCFRFSPALTDRECAIFCLIYETLARRFKRGYLPRRVVRRFDRQRPSAFR